MTHPLTACRHQAGLALIELMISMAIGLVVLAGVGTIYVDTISANRDTLSAARLNQDLRAAMGIIQNDLQRASYWGEASSGVNALGTTDNPFTVVDTANPGNTTDIQVLEAGSCILYSYDSNGNGSVDADEFYGFKLKSKAIMMRTSGDNTADCGNGHWESLTNSTILHVTTLSFNSSGSTCVNVTSSANGCASPASGDITVELRQVAINLNAELASDSTIRISLSEQVRIRNDRVIQN